MELDARMMSHILKNLLRLGISIAISRYTRISLLHRSSEKSVEILRRFPWGNFQIVGYALCNTRVCKNFGNSF